MANLGKKIGQGYFSKVFLNAENPKEVFFETTCQVKECMAHDWFPDSPLFPDLEYVELGLYKGKFYEDAKSTGVLSKLDNHNKALYRALRKLRVSVAQKRDLFFAWHKQFDTLEAEFPEECEALKEALDATGNFGTSAAFEISPRNVATENGKLILLDCFFMAEKIERKRA